ncbi:DsbC family protein [Candidatus Magnetominusculus xianensis]|uniref:Protein-disulfide isomerase n=1 Tax=Candidatus Magnetominusculus xianensis TaxID=1748249 RepID=A0ABR5SIC6_9BACT|nr:DsbC family protein [Candidatus Magnetominusculus xianensis]KWT92165.1 protein-disulfide isomerase [Candidatus Magnetominusculus xianensis]MBF0404664.1 DsbC family protein [Nitrospirota bacterium]
MLNQLKTPQLLSVLLSVLLCVMCVQTVWASSVEDKINEVFPDVKPDSVKESQIKGLYEIVKGNEIVYFDPITGYLIFGEIVSPKEKKSITAERKRQLREVKLKNMPLDKALKFGSGKHTVVEFTDPDCPFCRKAAAYLASRSDITRYVFLFPIPQLHPKAADKAKFIFCAEDKKKALEDVMSGKYDSEAFEICKDPKVEELLKDHKTIGESAGVTGTPLLIINGTFVDGANMPLIEKLLSDDPAAASKDAAEPKK